MRDYSKVAPTLWTGRTGRAIREAGPDAQIIAMYLLTCPSANMIGLYYLPLPTLCHETGRPFEGASEALRRLSEAGFAYYDEDTETVWVPMMARYQIGPHLEPKDNRVKGVLKELEPYRKSPFFMSFVDLYWEAFALPEPKPLRSPFEAPSKPLRSQEQEQEQEQDQEQEQKQDAPSAPPPPPVNAHALPDIRRPESSPETWSADDFWAWAQDRRRAGGLAVERRKPKDLGRWYSAALMSLGGKVSALQEAFYRFGENEYWQGRDPPLPFSGFVSQWDRFLPPGVTRAAS